MRPTKGFVQLGHDQQTSAKSKASLQFRHGQHLLALVQTSACFRGTRKHNKILVDFEKVAPMKFEKERSEGLVSHEPMRRDYKNRPKK